MFTPDGEDAYLVAISKNGGRNDWAGYALIRPKLKQAKVLDYGGQTNDMEKLGDFGDGSIVIIGSAGSGQGTTESSLYLVKFDGWDVKVLRQTSMGDNSGACGEDGMPACEWGDAHFNLIVPASTNKERKVLETVLEKDDSADNGVAVTTKIHVIPVGEEIFRGQEDKFCSDEHKCEYIK